MPTVEAEGATLYYEVYGDGPGLVLAHGSGGNALSWYQQIPHFERSHRVVVIEHRGFGRSRCDDDARDPHLFPADLAAVLDDAGVERAALVCQSMGGWTGLPFAVAHPERTAALVLCGTPGGVLTDGIVRDMELVPAKAAKRTVAGMTLALDFPERDPARTRLYEQIAALNPPDAIAVFGAVLARTRIEPAALADYRVPTLLLVGSDDAFFSVESLRGVADAIPGADFRVCEGCGHSPYFESPDTFNAWVAAFLAEHR
ncbi:MAG: alpha/beta hydrolase [Myxococcota bacterium]|nr:alpha/beta hydrolase [Myxococcota bacterium]